MVATSLLTVFLFCSAATSTVLTNPVVLNTSPVTIPLTKRVDLTGLQGGGLLKRDQARAQALRIKVDISVQLELPSLWPVPPFAANDPINNTGVAYLATVGIGSPPTTYQLLIDTGSANTWIGADKSYVKTHSSVPLNQPVSASYGSGNFSGNEYLETVTITPQLVIHNQSIGVADSSTGIFGTDGIIGIGPVNLTIGTLTNQPNSTIPTVTDNLYSQHIIAANKIAISFQPTNQTQVMNGELTWGGTDSSKYTGVIRYTPLTSVHPSSDFWGIDQSITYGTSATPILASTAGIVDTGTTLLLLATDAYNRYVSATGAVFDNTAGLLQITSTQYTKLQSLFFHINGVTYEFTPNAQLWPRALNSQVGGTASGIYLAVGDLGTTSGKGLDFISGYVFLERFYSVYDRANSRVGFATTPYTNSMIN